MGSRRGFRKGGKKEFMVTTFLREKHGWGLLPQVVGALAWFWLRRSHNEMGKINIVETSPKYCTPSKNPGICLENLSGSKFRLLIVLCMQPKREVARNIGSSFQVFRNQYYILWRSEQSAPNIWTGTGCQKTYQEINIHYGQVQIIFYAKLPERFEFHQGVEYIVQLIVGFTSPFRKSTWRTFLWEN